MSIFSSLQETRTLLAQLLPQLEKKKIFANNKTTPPTHQKNPPQTVLSIYERRNRANKPLDQISLISRVTCHTMLQTTDGQLDESIQRRSQYLRLITMFISSQNYDLHNF